MKTALICGISGQDGAYLASFLLSKGYKVIGTSRDAGGNDFNALKILKIFDQVQIISMSPTDFQSVFNAISKIRPQEIYNLAGQTSVSLSFEQPIETFESIGLGTLNLLESIRLIDASIHLYNAGSGECFGDTLGQAVKLDAPFNPLSPYAVAKASSYWQVKNYREAYGLFACTGILFNHESPLRPARFVTQKIIQGAYKIFKGSNQKLVLGNLNISRDWGWAPEYVEAMWMMLQKPDIKDFVIATGETCSLEKFVDEAFSQFNLNWSDHVEVSQNLFRPSEIKYSAANVEDALINLGWQAKSKMSDVVKKMAEALL